MTTIGNALAERTAPPARKTFETALALQAPALTQLLPRGMELERFKRLGLTELSRNPKLMDCDPLSFLAALTTCATLGLEPGPLGHAYLVPFKRQVTFILGYKGIVALAYRSTLLKEIRAWPVYEGDEWSGLKATETGDHFAHVPAPPKDRGAALLFVGRARLRTGGNLVHVMYPEEIEARAKRSAAFKAGDGPWLTDRIPMSCKTVIRGMQPMLPLSAQFTQALEVDEAVQVWEADAVVAATEEAVDDDVA